MPGSPTAKVAATPSQAAAVYRRMSEGLHWANTVMKESPLTVLGLSAKRNPKISEIIDQARIICEVS